MIRKFYAGALALLASLSLAAAPAEAASSTITVKDGLGNSQTMGTTTRASDSALIYNMDTVVPGTATDIGASITTANTAQQLAATNLSRRGFSIQDQTTGDCYLNGTATATTDYHSLKIPAGSYYETKDSHVGTGALSIICTATGGVYARQW